MEPNRNTIVDFINRIGERQRHTLAIIHPNKDGLQGSTYEANQLPYMLKFIDNSQKAGYGIYYSLNEGCHVTKQRGWNGKLLANEIIKVHMLGFDIDYIIGDAAQRNNFEKQITQLVLDTQIKPSIIVATGGGIQVLFVLISPLNVALSNAKIPTETEARSDAVSIMMRDDITLLYADIVAYLNDVLKPMIANGLIKIDKLSNIDRVFRMPGTINYPTEAKIAKGATVRPAVILYDADYYWDYTELREAVPKVTTPIIRKEKSDFVERPNAKWTYYKKAHFLCEYIKDHKLADENENYTWNLMFPLFGMINKNEITASEGRELWIMATSTGRETAYGNYEQKWDKRKIANYTNRDLGSLIYFCRQHDCLIPWSAADIEKQIDIEAKAITMESMRNPIIVSDTELLGF